MREDRLYYERRSLEDSMRIGVWCLIGLVVLLAAAGIYELLR